MGGKEYKIKLMELGYKQYDVARQIGVNHIVLNMFLNGRQGLRPDALVRLEQLISKNKANGGNG